MRFRIGDKVRVLDGEKISEYTQGWNMPEFIGDIVTINDCEQYSDGRVAYRVKENYYIFDERGLEPVDADGGKIAYAPNGAPLFWMPEPEKPVSIELPELVFDKKQAEKLAEEIKKRLANSGIGLKEEKKMPTKFTFYVTEGTRPDKSCNGTIPTMTTMVSYIDKYGCIMKGTATCDKADYDERQGVLEAFANAFLDGNFDRDFNRAVKANELADKKKRTCTYCGKVFDTVEECEAEEAWHVERRKARHERYLLRKRAKEIAFEEAAQKMAKEMMNEKK